MDLIDKISTQYIPQYIPYPEGETTQRPEMRAYERYIVLAYDVYYERLVVFI